MIRSRRAAPAPSVSPDSERPARPTVAAPSGRSRFVLGMLGLAFLALAGRAAYVQLIGNDFFLDQGNARFARTLELPANRGRILDRNGTILATSVEAQSVWAIPEDVDLDDPQLPAVARVLGMPLADLKRRLEVNKKKSFMWVQRQVDTPVALKVKELGVKGIHLRKEYC